MYSIHSILVHIPAAADAADKTLTELTKEELTEMVINYATEETERFCGLAFDYRTLLDGEAYDEEHNEFFNYDWNGDMIEKEIIRRWSKSDTVECFLKQFSDTDITEMLNQLSSYEGDEFSFTVGVFGATASHAYIVYDYIRKMIFDALAVGWTGVLELSDILYSLYIFLA